MSLYVSGFRPGLRPRVTRRRRSPTNTPSENGGGGTRKPLVKPSDINLPKLLPPRRPAEDTFAAPEKTKTPLRLADSPRTELETLSKGPRLTPKRSGALKGANEKPGPSPPSPITKGLDSPARGGAKGPVLRDSPPPIRVDWTARLRMYPFVESQNLGNKVCGACWAFAVGGALDVAVAHQRGKVEAIFSKQQLIDCVTENKGCAYGNLNSPLDYLVEKGLTLSKNYPYRADAKECNTTAIIGTPTRIASWEHLDPEDIEKALVTGPVVTAMHFPPELQHYKREVADPVDCSNDENMLNHAAVIVGYEPDHWIIRNSHGLQYGWKGHLLLKKNTCGVGIYSFAIKL
ncbi:cathepsin K [Bemisia tabaci]|uniref:cathepsin K n=1 Tax=Bemisia tabaci TaxID=7038 RepID=UPI003B284BD1